MDTVRTVSELRARVGAWRREGARVGMVPTMGALHAGHRSLVEEAQRRTDRVVVTLFVNPAQFAPSEDLGAYPRDEAADRRTLEDLGVDALFAPDAQEIYPPGFDTRVVVGGPAEGLEGAIRPHFFTGVATVVTKLLLAGLPDLAFFGEKDFQQLLVVRKLVRDLNIPTTIVGCPTVRESDGLALSSRNAYLGRDERVRAPRLFAALQRAADELRRSVDPERALAEARASIVAEGFELDYLELRDAETLAPAPIASGGPRRLLAAARLGRTRLIDNVAV